MWSNFVYLVNLVNPTHHHGDELQLIIYSIATLLTLLPLLVLLPLLSLLRLLTLLHLLALLPVYLKIPGARLKRGESLNPICFGKQSYVRELGEAKFL